MENKERKQKISFVNTLINNLGKRNYEKVKNSKPEEYTTDSNNTNRIQKLLQNTQNKNLNTFRGYKVPMKYTGWYIKDIHPDEPKVKAMSESDNQRTLGRTTGTMDAPQTEYYLPITQSMAHARNAIGHELGHSKYALNINSKIEKLKNKYKDDNKFNKAKEKIITKYHKNKEAQADKYISSYLKQIGISKNDRKAHYYLHKILENPNGRYQGKFGNLKYLKDYIFGFSNLPTEYHLYKPLSPEWKQAMQQYFYQIHFDAQKKRRVAPPQTIIKNPRSLISCRKD